MLQGDSVMSPRTPTGYGDGVKLYVARDREDHYKNGKKSEVASQKATPHDRPYVVFRKPPGRVRARRAQKLRVSKKSLSLHKRKACEITICHPNRWVIH